MYICSVDICSFALYSRVVCYTSQVISHSSPSPQRYTQPPIVIKQGMLQGVVVEPRGIRGCEQYLGIPYAAPPVGELRFMPPGSAPPWTNILFADSLGPVCPQRMPDMKGMSSDRKEKFKRLSHYLSNQSEDCLYLNIYAPIRGKCIP